jgi:hypothetical protein
MDPHQNLHPLFLQRAPLWNPLLLYHLMDPHLNPLPLHQWTKKTSLQSLKPILIIFKILQHFKIIFHLIPLLILPRTL